MNLFALTDSLASLPAETDECSRCRAVLRIGNGLCLSCLLRVGTAEEDDVAVEDFDAALAAVAVADTHWRLGNYEILEEIGRGGAGVIYRARQRHSRRIVALKRILSHQAEGRETLARFRREAEAAASLDHPNILPIYEVGESGEGVPYFSMKYASGGSLQEVGPALRDRPREIVRLMAKVTRAVQHAHRQGILHRDLKPGNILLDAHGEPFVSDFGLAKWLDTSSDLTRTLTVFGTPGFIAPEQAEGAANLVTPAADVYSLGAILFTLLSGRPPFLGEHALAVLKQASTSSPPKLRSVIKGANKDLETICARCLEREPKARYCCAGDLAEDLERWMEGRPILARRVSLPVTFWRWSRRNPALATSLAACLGLTAVAGIRWVQGDNFEAAVQRDELSAHYIAVLPVLNLDNAAKDENLTTVLADSLQTAFGRFGPGRAVAIVDQNAERASSGNSNTLAVAAQAVGARAALVGTRRLVNGKPRLSLRLVDTQGRLLWTRVVEAQGEPSLIEALSHSVARNIYDCLNPGGSTANRGTTKDPGRQDGPVRDLILAGKALLDDRANPNVDRALACFQAAIELAPKSAWANASFAGAAAMKLHFQPDPTLLAKSEAAARRAIELEPNAPDGHRAAGALFFEMGRFPSAIEEGFSAIELGGVEERVSAELGQVFKMTGRPDKAIRWFEIAAQSEGRPANFMFVLGDCWADLCDDTKAEAIYRRVSQLRPDIPDGWIGICRLRLLQGSFAAAHEICQQNQLRQGDFEYVNEMAAQTELFARNFPQAEQLYQSLSRSAPGGGGAFYGALSYQSVLGYLRLKAGDPSGRAVLARELATEQDSLRLAPTHPETLYRIAAIESCLGDVPSALKHLQAATAAGWIDYRSLGLDPRFENLASEPQFQKILTDLQTQVQSIRWQMASRSNGPYPGEKTK